MNLPPQPWMGVVAGLLFVGAMTLWVVLARRYPSIIRTPPPMPQLEPAPERETLPQRVPVAWPVAAYEEFESINPRLRLAVHRTLLLLLEKHANEWADELARELEGANDRIIRGELAS